MPTKIKLLVLSVVLASSTGCSILTTDRRDTPWDPRGGQSLFTQLPNWEGGANQRCCGHLRSCQAHQTPNC